MLVVGAASDIRPAVGGACCVGRCGARVAVDVTPRRRRRRPLYCSLSLGLCRPIRESFRPPAGWLASGRPILRAVVVARSDAKQISPLSPTASLSLASSFEWSQRRHHLTTTWPMLFVRLILCVPFRLYRAPKVSPIALGVCPAAWPLVGGRKRPRKLN